MSINLKMLKQCFYLFIIMYFSFSFITIMLQTYNNNNPYNGFNTSRFILQEGYPLEIHQVNTEDGYTLTVHRISHGRYFDNIATKSVLLIHGLLHSSTEFVNHGPDNSLGFLLADSGYDVWIINARGTSWSKKHILYDADKDSHKFYNYSFHEIGYYDIPATIDYMLDNTKRDKVHLISTSQGATATFVTLTERPFFNNKVVSVNVFGPAIFTSNTKSVMSKIVIYYSKILQRIINYFGHREVGSKESFLGQIAKLVCNENSYFIELCYFAIAFSSGPSVVINENRLSAFSENFPDGASTKQILHFTHLATHNDFVAFDYLEENLKIYGQETPSQYNLSKITAPVAIYYGTKDNLIVPKDIRRLKDVLLNCTKFHAVPNYSHIDFFYALNAGNTIHRHIINHLDLY